jgi:hypothetical protein
VNPDAGGAIPGSGGWRKIRWSRAGSGKRGGARVIYFNGEDGRIWLPIAYKKAKLDNLPTDFLARLKREVEPGCGNDAIPGQPDRINIMLTKQRLGHGLVIVTLSPITMFNRFLDILVSPSQYFLKPE